MQGENLSLFSLNSGRALAERVARKLDIDLARHEERNFEWGQHKTRPLESVRGRDVFVLQSLHGDEDESANDKLCRLLFSIGALVDASAGRVTAVVPLLCYTRKERRTKPRDPVMTHYVSRFFEAVETDRVVTLEVHNLAAFQNSFRCRTEHLEAHGLFADYFADRLGGRDLAVVSPDVGGVNRSGAREVYAAAAHGAFTPEASKTLAAAPIEKIVILDHIPPFALDRTLVATKVEILEGAELWAEAIRRIHTHQSLTEVFER